MMSYQGVDLTAEAGQSLTTISWHEPHPIFVILLVGSDETPFGIQKDLLCAQSPYFRQEFAKQGQNDRVEHLVKLSGTDKATFGCFQNFIYTGDVYDKRGGKEVPDYPILMGVWKLATELKMAPLRVAVLDAMAERRQQTTFIPSTQLLIEAWKQTEEGSGLRKMLIGWAAEHMRSIPEQRKAFAKSLPQEILFALALALSDPPAIPTVAPQSVKHNLCNNPDELDADRQRTSAKRPRRSGGIDLVTAALVEPNEFKPGLRKPIRKSEPVRPTSRRVSGLAAAVDSDISFTPERELEFCRGLIERMISGPGYWTRYVANFKKPVNPAVDNVPNYFAVVKKPMDLSTIKMKMDNGEYSSAREFEEDMRLIFQNCYEYWTRDDPIWKSCEDFENFFNSQWAARQKYISIQRKIKTEIIDGLRD